MIVQDFLDRLDGVRQEADGGYVACCPAHNDRRPSLAVKAGDDGRVLVHCRAGCATEAVVKAMGLTLADLMPDDDRDRAPAAWSNGRQPEPAPTIYETPEAALRSCDWLGKRTGVWKYLDATGAVVGVVGRWETSDGKTIRPVSRNGAGWKVVAMPEPRPLYRLPELLDATGRVYVVEGEKCAVGAASIGLAATTSAGGSKAAGKADWSPLAGREVVILPDQDAAGKSYAADVARLLHALDPPATVRIVRLPDLAEKGDIVDWLDQHDAVDPEQLRESVEALASATPIAQSRGACDHQPNARNSHDGVVRCMADVEPRSIAWLWPGRIPRGRLTLLVGRPGEGKSMVTLDLAARVSTGRVFPDGSACERGSVLLLSAEDDPHDTLRPRLDAAGANVRRVHLLSAVRTSGNRERCVTLADLDVIDSTLQTLGDCRLLVVDPIGSYMSGGIDAHRDNQVRAVLAPLAALAEAYGVAIVVVAHRRKSSAHHADDSAIGSRAFTGIARAVWHVARDEDDPQLRYLLAGKSNIAPESTGLAFRIGGDPPRIEWQPEAVAMSADDAVRAENARQQRGPEPRERDEAVEWLRESLANGPRRAKDMHRERKNRGLTERTVDRAKRLAGVQCYRVADGWWWTLHDGKERGEQPKNEECGDLGDVPRSEGDSTPSVGQAAKSLALGVLDGEAPCDPNEDSP